MTPRRLTATEFAATFHPTMENITGQEDVHQSEGVIDLTPYIRAIPRADLAGNVLLGEDIVEFVYRCGDESYDHVAFPCLRPNSFLVVVVHLNQNEPYGHHLLDLHKEYDLKSDPMQ